MKNGRYVEYGKIKWYKDDVLHREDGPAVEYASGTKMWFIYGVYHREDGPAVETVYGEKYWCVNGKYHRINGPAIQLEDGTEKWYLNGVLVDISLLDDYDGSRPLTDEEMTYLILSA